MFGGFLPSRPASARARALERLLAAAATAELPLVLYEAPHRMATLLAALSERVPDATVAAARELTKRHEEVVVGAPAEVASQLASPRGEFTVVVSGLPPAEPSGARGGCRCAGGGRSSAKGCPIAAWWRYCAPSASNDAMPTGVSRHIGPSKAVRKVAITGRPSLLRKAAASPGVPVWPTRWAGGSIA